MTQVRETLAGRYELGEVIGRGGMGVVYGATDRVLDRSVAIKLLPADLAADPTFVTRFQREARAAAALNHPNIVSIYDSGSDEGTRFIVMECVPGRSLARLLGDEGCLDSERAVDIATQIAAALAAAHHAGVIHRDIKPANVMVDNEGRVKVLDFGIARATAHTTLTRHDVILGSAPYLAPEVTTGSPADERSDIYALGCVLYAMLTGDPPFSGGLPAAIMHQHVSLAPRSPSELNPAVPPGLEALLLTMLAKDPAQRPQTATELVKALPGALANATSATIPLLRRREPPTAQTRVLASEPTAADAPAGSQGGYRRLIAPLLAGLAIAAVVAFVALAAGGGGTRRPAHGAAARIARTGAATHRTASAPHTTRSVTASVSTSTPATPPASVTGAASGLTSLLVSDLRGGSIDQQAAQQIYGRLRDTLHAFYAGKSADALKHLGDLTAQISQLQSSGDIQPAAAGPLNSAVSQLQAALERSAAQTSAGPNAQPLPPGGQPGGGPPKDGPPGQVKKAKKAKDHGPGGGD